VFGPRRETIASVTHPLSEGATASIPELGLSFTVLDVPGHTRGHIAYYHPQQRWLFCGDTLFAGGCGRVFEGTPAQMAASLDKLAALPDQTQVYCAHEYTLPNLRFAQAAEPGNSALRERMRTEQAKREQGRPTVPSTIGLEKATNPFLRYREPAIARHLLAIDRIDNPEPLSVFTALREWKNVYR
jgi:hydroxyacylglutathione hydrolase